MRERERERASERERENVEKLLSGYKYICNYMHSSCARGPSISCVDSFPCVDHPLLV